MASWETVAISLGAAALTGGVALAIGILNNRTQRRLHFRTMQIDAARDLSRHLTGASDALHHARSQPGEEKPRENAEHLVGELSPLIGAVSLLFGEDSPTEQEATAAVEALRNARDLLAEEGSAEWQAAMEESLSHRAKFEEAARKAVGA